MALKDITNRQYAAKGYKRRKLGDSASGKLPDGYVKEMKASNSSSVTIRRQRIKDDRRHELDNVIDKKNRQMEELQAIQSDLWNARADLPELQLEVKRLEKKYTAMVNVCSDREKEVAQLMEHRKNLDKEMECDFGSFKKEVMDKFNKKVEEIGTKYDHKASELMEKRQLQFNEKMKELQKREMELKVELENVDKELESEKTLIKQKHELKLANDRLDREKQIKESEAQIKLVVSDIKSLQDQLALVTKDVSEHSKHKDSLEKDYSLLKDKADQFKRKTDNLKNEVSELTIEEAAKQSEKESIIKHIKSLSESRKSYEEDTTRQYNLRLKLHEQLQELKGNIRVFCRIKPSSSESFLTSIKESETMSDFKDHLTIQEMEKKKSYGFAFDKVFSQNQGNKQIFCEISQLVQSALDGYNVCIFAYGQTGSGKTYTMSKPKDGMIPLSINQIFHSIDQMKPLGWEYKVTGQFLEIYGNHINDLLANSYLHNLDRSHVELKNIASRQKIVVTNVKKVELDSPAMVSRLLARANGNRRTATTKMNDRSSRSHSIFIISIEGKCAKTGSHTEGILNLVDLAGSERIAKSGVTGIRLREARAINQSLSSLGDVISSLNTKERHIPFRNSKLTYLLQYSLGGNSKTLMFVNISSDLKHFKETINSLRFAQKVNCTHIGRASKRN